MNKAYLQMALYHRGYWNLTKHLGPVSSSNTPKKHLLQFLCQTREKKLNPTDRQVCIHNDWWTEIIWNKDKECYYSKGILKRLHDYNETDSEESEEEQHQEDKEPTVDQQIRQTPIDLALQNSPVINTISLPTKNLTPMTATAMETATMSTTQATFGPAPTAQQRIAATMQKALLHKGKGTGPPGHGGPGQPRGGGQPAAAQQPVQVAADIKAMGNSPKSLIETELKQMTLLKKSRDTFASMQT